jgi:hypothetical protein
MSTSEKRRTLTNLRTGEVHELGPGRTTLGTAPSCTIVLQRAPDVQNRPGAVHAMIVGNALVDLGSTHNVSWTHLHNPRDPSLPSKWYMMEPNVPWPLDHGEEICFGGHSSQGGVHCIQFKPLYTYYDRYPAADMWDVFQFKAVDPCADGDACPICFESVKGPATMACGHRFCSICLSAWLGTQKGCPMCREP